MGHHLITLMITLPLLGALFQAFVPSVKEFKPGLIARWIALFCSLAASFCGIALVLSLEASSGLQATETLPWVGSYAITYDMGVDGLNALLILLVALVFPVMIAYEWNQKIAARGMHGLLLILQAAFFGVVCAQELFLLFFFWALSTFPFYFLIGIWGGEGRETASFRTMIANSLGNALLFSALVLVYYSVEPHTFLIRELSGGHLTGKTFGLFGSEHSVESVAFVLMSIGLALRGPIWPFHGWFSRAANESPPSVFVALSAVSVPMAIYIFIRLSYSLFPGTLAAASHVVVVVGVLNLIMGGILAAAQTSLQGLLAFISLSEVGLVLIGVGSQSPIGLVGAVYQQLVMGLGLAGFGLFSGLLIDRVGDPTFISKDGERLFGGIAIRAPAVAVVAGVVVASLLGFPGFGGFVAHALVIIGSYAVHPATVAIACVALLLANYYLFTMYRYVFLGKPSSAAQGFADLTLRERAYLLPLVAGLLFAGIYPKPLLDLVRPTVLSMLAVVK